MTRYVPMRLFVATAVASTGTAESGVVDLTRATPRSLLVDLAADSGTPDVKIEIAISTDGVTFGDYADFDSILASSAGAFGSTPSGPHIQPLDDFPVAPYVTFRLTGVGSNPATTTATIDLFVEEL